MPGDEFASVDRWRLTEAARTLVDRAHAAGSAAGRTAPGTPRFGPKAGPEPSRSIDRISGESRALDEVGFQLTDAMQMLRRVTVQLQTRLAGLRAEVQGLRGEGPEILARLQPADPRLVAPGDQFAREIADLEQRLSTRLGKTELNGQPVAAARRGD